MDRHDAVACVQLVPIFQELDEETVGAVAALVQERYFKKGDYLFMAGDDAQSLVIIAHGQAKVTQTTANGREQLIRVLTSGDFDGEAILFQDTGRTTTAQALVPTQACTISRHDFQQLLATSQSIALNMLNALGKRVAALESQAAATLTSSVGERLATYLVETSSALGQVSFKLPIAKKDLAAYLGTSPETISRKLTQFSNQHLISQSGRSLVTILNADGLMTIE